MPKINPIVEKIPRVGLRKFMEMPEASHPDVIHFEVGQPSFRTPKNIIEKVCASLMDDDNPLYTGYTANAGVPSLKEALVEKLRDRDGFKDINEDNVFVTAGSTSTLARCFTLVVEPGDEVLIPDPGWYNYWALTQLLGGVPRLCELSAESGFLPDVDELSKLVTPKTKMIIVNSPSNPTGAVYPTGLMKELVKFAHDNDIFMLSDEAYGDLIYEGEHVSPGRFEETDSERHILSVYSFSKSYAMAGWRVGYAVISRELAKQMVKIQEPYESCASSISQKAAEEALKLDGEVRKMVEEYRRRWKTALDVLTRNNQLFYKPRGAFYILIDVTKSGMSPDAFAERLLKQKKVAVAPCDFGKSKDRYIRVSWAQVNEDVLETGLERICGLLS